MRYCDLLTIFGKGVLYGVGITAVVEGGIIGYHNIDDFRHAVAPPANSTLDSCLKDWGAENALEFLQVMYALISIAPAIVIGIIISCLESRKASSNSTEAAPLLITDEVTNKTPRSTYLKITVAALHAIGLAFVAIGVIGTPLTLASGNFSSEYRKDNPDATDKDCYNSWDFEKFYEFAGTLTILLCLLIGGGLISYQWQSAKDKNLDSAPPAVPSL